MLASSVSFGLSQNLFLIVGIRRLLSYLWADCFGERMLNRRVLTADTPWSS